MMNIKKIYSEAETIWQASDDEASKKAKLLSLLRIYLDEKRAQIKKAFLSGKKNGIETGMINAEMVDELISFLFSFGAEKVFHLKSKADEISVIAVGGYGRKILSPYSDIDLLFMPPSGYGKEQTKLIEFVLYMMWDLKFKLGHGVRTLKESIKYAKEDMTIRTNLLEARLICGNKKQFSEFEAKYRKEIADKTIKEFVKAKLDERNERSSKMEISRYLVEPNVKNGRGGLRDLHVLFWLAKYIFGIMDIQELAQNKILSESTIHSFIKAHDFFVEVRCHLHYLAGRIQDTLTFESQKEIAERMNYKDISRQLAVEKFMKTYFLHAKIVGNLTGIFCALIEEKYNLDVSNLASKKIADLDDNFIVIGKRLYCFSESEFLNNPIDFIKLFRVVQINDCDIHPKMLQLMADNLHKVIELRKDPEANKIFLDILCGENAEKNLRRMSDAGVLAVFIPAFARITAQMQFDMYHVYTTDEHTIRTVGSLQALEQNNLGLLNDVDTNPADINFFSEMISNIHNKRIIYVAAFLHDIAKGRGGDHSFKGEKISRKLAKRLGLNADECEEVAWLVGQHLLIPHTAFKRDIGQEKVIKDFLDKVQSPERLKALTAITVSDVMAVGPKIWTNWKSTLIKELYRLTEEKLYGSSKISGAERLEAKKQSFIVQYGDKLGSETILEHISGGDASYWLSYDEEEIFAHANLIDRAIKEQAQIAFDITQKDNNQATDITIYTNDSKGLFSRICGGIAISRTSIINAKITTFENGMILDSFMLEDMGGGAILEERKQEKLKKNISRAINNEIDIKAELHKVIQSDSSSKYKDLMRKGGAVFIDNNISATHTIIEITADDKVGFLFEFSDILQDMEIQISSAHIYTYGARVADVFYVKDKFGFKVADADLIENLRSKLEKLVKL